MSLEVVQRLRKLPAFEASSLIGRARQYVKNDDFVNLLNSYDLNNKSNDKMLILQFNSFASVPGLKAQVNTWLQS
jgi:hypothetical protein